MPARPAEQRNDDNWQRDEGSSPVNLKFDHSEPRQN